MLYMIIIPLLSILLILFTILSLKNPVSWDAVGNISMRIMAVLTTAVIVNSKCYHLTLMSILLWWKSWTMPYKTQKWTIPAVLNRYLRFYHRHRKSKRLMTQLSKTWAEISAVIPVAKPIPVESKDPFTLVLISVQKGSIMDGMRIQLYGSGIGMTISITMISQTTINWEQNSTHWPIILSTSSWKMEKAITFLWILTWILICVFVSWKLPVLSWRLLFLTRILKRLSLDGNTTEFVTSLLNMITPAASWSILRTGLIMNSPVVIGQSPPKMVCIQNPMLIWNIPETWITLD